VVNISLTSCGVLISATLFYIFNANKYGGADAWGIWNTHAKFLYYPKIWQHLLADGQNICHPDYPLMLSSLVAFGWHSIGSFSFLVPFLLSYFGYTAVIFLTYKALKDNGQTIYACLAFAILTTNSSFMQIAAAQESDMLLSLLVLLTFVIYQQIIDNKTDEVFWLGFICASCGWVKNEGLAFYLLFTLTFVTTNLRHHKKLFGFIKGSILPLLVIFLFKLFFAPQNDLVAGNAHASTIAKLTDAGRYIKILKAYILMLVNTYPFVLLLACVMIAKPGKKFSLPLMVICELMVVYFGVYLLSPHNLDWHLRTSLNRLFEHVFPAFVYLAVLSFKDNRSITRLFGADVKLEHYS